MTPLEIARDAAQEAMDKFHGRPLVWGENDCGRLVALVLARRGLKPAWSRAAGYKTPEGALRRMRALGYRDTTDWLDDIGGLVRKAPAFVTIGDIVALPGVGMTALTVALGNGRVLGFLEDDDGICGRVMTPVIPPVACWGIG